MSQVSFKIDWNNTQIEVVSGWDLPLQYYHLTIYDETSEDDECIFSCLNMVNVFQTKTLELWINKLKELKISVPDGFWERVERKEGNITHSFINGKWSTKYI